MHQRQVALGVDHHPFGFGPKGTGQKDVGVAIGLGVKEGILSDDQLGSLQAFNHFLAVRNGCDRVGADDPAGLDLTRAHLLEHRHGATADFPGQAVARDAPQVLDEHPIGLDQHRTLPGQTGAHVTHFTTAHGIRLPGQGKRPTARPADRSGG
ncbi:hypothetical protein D3C80_572100 [compost metagenome]